MEMSIARFASDDFTTRSNDVEVVCNATAIGIGGDDMHHNMVNAGMADWPDGYEWCSYAAACRGDETARSGYGFVYGGKGRSWPELSPTLLASGRRPSGLCRSHVALCV